MNTNRWLTGAKAALAWGGVLLAALALAWAAVRWLLPFLAPFLIAFALAFLLRRPVRFLARTAGIARRPAAGLLLCLFAAVTLGSLGYLTARLLLLARLALARFPAFYAAECEPLLTAAAARLAQLAGRLGLNAEQNALPQAVGGLLLQLTEELAARLGGVLAALPGLLIPFVFACVATVYFTLDYDRLMQALHRRLGTENADRLRQLKENALSLTARLLRAYLLLFLLTFVQLCVGFWLLKIPGAPGLALLTALVDILPVLGVGTVLLPAAAVCAVSGQGSLALGLVVLYAVIWTVRQLCEPRLVGKQLGLHPLASLFFLYAGLRLFGLVGALLLPAAATMLWQLHRKKTASPPPEASADTAAPEG